MKPARTKLDEVKPRLRVAHDLAWRTRRAAQDLRHRETASEKVLWDALRGRRFMGLKFRRQQAVGPFVVDIYCAEQRLVVEVDGGIHDLPDQRELDVSRQEAIESIGIRVVRISHETVVHALSAALATIAAAMNALPDSKLPSPLEGEGPGVRVRGGTAA